MLLEYIERVRQRPYAARKRFAFVVAVIGTAVVAGLWALALPSHLQGLRSDTETGSVESSQKQAQNDLNTLIEKGKEIQNTLPKEEITDAMNAAFGSVQEEGGDAPVLIEGTTTATSSRIIIATTSAEQRP